MPAWLAYFAIWIAVAFDVALALPFLDNETIISIATPEEPSLFLTLNDEFKCDKPKDFSSAISFTTCRFRMGVNTQAKCDALRRKCYCTYGLRLKWMRQFRRCSCANDCSYDKRGMCLADKNCFSWKNQCYDWATQQLAEKKLVVCGRNYVQYGSKIMENEAGMRNGMQGSSTSMARDGRLAVGAPGDSNDLGCVRVYTRMEIKNGWSFILEAKLVGTPSTKQAAQGISVAISQSGDLVLSGAYGDVKNLGAVFVFERQYNISLPPWVQMQKLTPPAATTGTQPWFGYAVALDSRGTVAAIGAPSDNIRVGAVFVYAKSNGSFILSQKLVGSGLSNCPNCFVRFGWSIAMCGDRIISGAPGNNYQEGVTVTFKWNAESYLYEEQLDYVIGTPVSKDGTDVPLWQGSSLACTKTRDDTLVLLVGGLTAYAFAHINETWVQEASLTNEWAVVAVNADFSGQVSALVGLPYRDSGYGMVVSYTRFGPQDWQRGGRLIPIANSVSEKSDDGEFGSSVLLLDQIGIVGARTDGADTQGSVFLYNV